MNFKALVAAGALLATQSFAIIGIGGHYAPGFGTKIDGMKEPAKVTESGSVAIKHGDFSGTMQGFGFKLWIDFLPIIDVEATFNFQMGSYDASLFVEDASGSVKEIPLEIELGGTPFGKADPKFVAMNGDLSITYPVTFLPIIRPYIGGGVTYHLNTFILNQKFVSSLIDDETVGLIDDLASIDEKDPDAAAQAKDKLDKLGKNVKDKIQDAAKDEGLNKSFGGHILVGMRAKLPIIPVAAYANFKYYFGGDYPSEVDSGDMTLELGVGFAL